MCSIDSDLNFEKISKALEKSAIDQFILTSTEEELIEVLLPGLRSRLPTMSDSQKASALHAQDLLLAACREVKEEINSKLEREKTKLTTFGHWF